MVVRAIFSDHSKEKHFVITRTKKYPLLPGNLAPSVTCPAEGVFFPLVPRESKILCLLPREWTKLGRTDIFVEIVM